MQREAGAKRVFEDADVEERGRVDVGFGVGPVDVGRVASARGARLVVGQVELGGLSVCDLHADVWG